MSVILPDVTVVVLDCVAHDLSRAAIADTLKQIDPAEVMVWSDKDIYKNGQWFETDMRSMRQVEETLWYIVPKYITTSHLLIIQWDGWVINGHKWRNLWLNCDYIGAPWWYKTLNVGNGGFSLRSASLAKFMMNNVALFPIGSPEDQKLCRDYRMRLTRERFYWADEYEAQKFAFERNGPWNTFGFHGLFNWPKVLDPDELQRRLSLCNTYVRSKIEWKELGIKPDFALT